MYAAIDIGGSKTLVCSLDDTGVIIQKIRFETPKDYDAFLQESGAAIQQLGNRDFRAAGVGVAATHLDRTHGRGVDFGNLPWKDVLLQADFERLLTCPVVIENDAKMAALSEAMLVKTEFTRVLYVTVSTGIGMGLVVDRVIDPNFGDGGGRTMLVEHDGAMVPWESFASGKMIVERYGMMAKDITDPATWRAICKDIAIGLIELIALVQPEIIVVGGSVGTYFERYGDILRAELEKYQVPMLPIPTLRGAGRPEEAVIFGCYDLAKATFSDNRSDA